MYHEWPFFQTTLSNMDMVLAKSDIAIASRYAELVPQRELRDQIFQRLRTEWQSSIDMLLAITGQEAPLAFPWLGRVSLDGLKRRAEIEPIASHALPPEAFSISKFPQRAGFRQHRLPSDSPERRRVRNACRATHQNGCYCRDTLAAARFQPCARSP
jgi:Phosphoenolpyruvate carboxylase